jgi:hypothetical protein
MVPSSSLLLLPCNDLFRGWALTLLSQDCLSYASTCQTIGLNTGFFASFTVFLAFNSEAFAYVLPIDISKYLDDDLAPVRDGAFLS